MDAAGRLYIVATPLGNLEDITYRAVRVLGEVTIIAAEDTRRTRKLVAHFGFTADLVSYREQNHRQAAPRLIDALQSGRDVALVSDAGTPVVSDPGSMLVAKAAEEGIDIIPIPGPTAVGAALSVSGFASDCFVFGGFIPAKKKARVDFFRRSAMDGRTHVFYEAPHRLAESLADAAGAMGNRRAVVCRELTKMNEEIIRGDLSDIAQTIGNRSNPVKGEITIVVEGASEGGQKRLSREELIDLIQKDGRPVKEIASDLSGASDMSRSDLYRLILEVRAEDRED